MSSWRRRGHWLTACSVVVCAAAAPIAIGATASAPPVSTWRNDHVLLAVTAGPDGATGFATALTLQVADRGTGPRASMLAFGDSRYGGGATVAEGGGGPIRLSTTSPAGGVSVQLTGSLSTLAPQPVTLHWTIDALPPGATMVVLEAFGNMRVAAAQTPTYSLAGGSIDLRMVQAPGTVVVPVGDPGDGGVAADAGPTGAGLQQHDFAPSTGITGAFLNGITQAGAGSWSTPDGDTGTYANAGSEWAGWPSFAGPAGAWQVDWAGSDTSVFGNPIAFVYVPIGDYWPIFRCKGGCFAPLPAQPPAA